MATASSSGSRDTTCCYPQTPCSNEPLSLFRAKTLHDTNPSPNRPQLEGDGGSILRYVRDRSVTGGIAERSYKPPAANQLAPKPNALNVRTPTPASAQAVYANQTAPAQQANERNIA